jgi:cytochrome c-type biogenesis protein CcmH
LLLWLLTPLVLVGGGLALWLQMRRRTQRGGDAQPPLTPEEEAKLAALMSDDVKKPG